MSEVIDNYLKSAEIISFVGESKYQVLRDDVAGFVKVDATDIETNLDSTIEAIFEKGQGRPVCTRRIIREFPNFINHRVIIRGITKEGPEVTIMRASGAYHTPGEPPLEFSPNLFFDLAFPIGEDQRLSYSGLYQVGNLMHIGVKMIQAEKQEDKRGGERWKTVAKLQFGGLEGTYSLQGTAEPVDFPGTNSTVDITDADQTYFFCHQLPSSVINLSYPKQINEQEWVERVEKEGQAGKGLLNEAPSRFHFSFPLQERKSDVGEI